MTDLLLWQLVDSAFPSGGFTHSNGLEAAAQYGAVRTTEDVWHLAATATRQAGRGVIPFVAAAHADPRALLTLDARMDLFLNQPVSNRASRAQGRAWLGTIRRVFPDADVRDIEGAARDVDFCGHLGPMFGAVMAALGVDVETACRLFLFQTARSVTSAAVRLGVIGLFDGQRVQSMLAGDINRAMEDCRGVAPEDAAQTAPILDLYQSTQDRLYSRLFQS